jgi:hypothetical protein
MYEIISEEDMNKNVRKKRIQKVIRKKQEREEVNEGTATYYRTKTI